VTRCRGHEHADVFPGKKCSDVAKTMVVDRKKQKGLALLCLASGPRQNAANSSAVSTEFAAEPTTIILLTAKLLKKNYFSKATIIMQFPAKKNDGCPKTPRDFPPRKEDILHPPSGCLETLLPSPRDCTGGPTLTSQPKFSDR